MFDLRTCSYAAAAAVALIKLLELNELVEISRQAAENRSIYRVFIKCCVFPLNVVIFLHSASSAAALVLSLCTLTDTKGKPREVKIFEKTQYLMNTLYNHCIKKESNLPAFHQSEFK